MGCFPCTGGSSVDKKQKNRKRKNNINNDMCRRDDDLAQAPPDHTKVISNKVVKKEEQQPKVVFNLPAENRASVSNTSSKSNSDVETDGFKAKRFAFADLVAATEDFKDEYFLGEGGFGKVYKGHFQDTNEIVAIKQLDHNGCQGTREFVVEVLTLSNAEHPNLVKLIGYCAEGDQRLLVYEHMLRGCLEDHLHDTRPSRKVLDWTTRMKIASGAAEGLEYLHNKMSPPIIYRDLKCSNILLGEGFHAKLSDFGLAKVGPSGDQTHVSTRVMGTYGYCAPDYAMTGQLTFKSDIYSFGVLLLEIITGRRAIDVRRSGAEQNLVEWARPLFKDRKKFQQMADPALGGQYPVRGLYQALAIAAMCIQEQPSMRPAILDIVKALKYLACQPYDPKVRSSPGKSSPTPTFKFKEDGDEKCACRFENRSSKSEEDE